MKTTSARPRKALAAATVTAGLMLVGLGAASAHVTVSPESTTGGGYTRLTFNVPSESETANTDKLEVQLPTDTPFTSVRAKPIEGWTAEVVRGELPEPVTVEGATITEAPLSVVWTANDEAHQITPDQYQAFSISVGRLPEAGTTVMLPTAQSYTDGTVKNWEEAMVEGEEEPESPAPSFVTTAEETAEGTTEGTTEAAPVAAADTETASDTTSDSTAITLGTIGLVAGVLGLAAGVFALLRTRGLRNS